MSQGRAEAGRVVEGEQNQHPEARQMAEARGLVPTAFGRENRSRFWTLPHSSVTHMACLLPHICSPGCARESGPSPQSVSGVEGACRPAHACTHALLTPRSAEKGIWP